MHHHNHKLQFLNNSLQLMLHTRSQRAGDESPDGQLAVKFLDDYSVLLKSHHVFPLKGFSKISVSTSLKYMMPQEWMCHPCLREQDPRTQLGLYKPLSEGLVRFLSFFSRPVLSIYDVFIPGDIPAQTPLSKPESPFLFLKMHAMQSVLMFQHDAEVRAYELAHTFHPQLSQREGQQGQPYQKFLVHFVIIAQS